MLSDSTILKHIARQPKGTAGFKQLVRELGMRGDERRELDSLLQKMVARGTLISVDSDRYALPVAAAAIPAQTEPHKRWANGTMVCT